jgi:uncharacterized protein (TIGR02246 family)
MHKFRLLLGVPVCLAIVTCFGIFCFAAEDDAAAAASRIVASLETAWNTGDGGAYTDNYWPDAELVNIFGDVYEGRDAITHRMDQMFAGAFMGSHVTSTIRKLRSLGPDVAVVDLTQDNTGIVGANGQRTPVQTRFKHILERRDGIWHIVASQNTRIIKAPF